MDKNLFAHYQPGYANDLKDEFLVSRVQLINAIFLRRLGWLFYS